MKLFVYNNRAVEIKYRGVEQLVARRAHNPKVVGSSPASATKEKPCNHHDYKVFFIFICFKFSIKTPLFDPILTPTQAEIVDNLYAFMH